VSSFEGPEGPTLQSVLDEVANLRIRGPWATKVRIAPDVWSALRRDQDLNRPLLAPMPALSVPVVVDDDLLPGQWRVEMSDGTERVS
jgi:hypothetical protein